MTSRTAVALQGGLALSLLLSTPALAQRSYGGLVPSSYHEFDAAAPTELMQPVDVELMLAEDAERPKGALRYGVLLDVELSPESAGLWEELPGGDLVWRLHISSPGALSLGLLFSEFVLPDGAQLFVRDGEGERTLGAYTRLNNKDNRQFQIEPLAGDSIVLEYLLPASAPEAGRLVVGQVIHDYRGVIGLLKSGDGGEDGSCETNVNCPVGAPWVNQINATARILSGGSLCTGSMLNNTANDGTQYFITASHCGSLNNGIFLFNYQYANCNGSGGTGGSGSVQGSVNLASNSSIDYRLVRITENIPASFGVYLAGWDRSDSFPSSTVTVHHPQGLPKKISFDNDPPSKSGQDWKINQWDLGVTQPGSSGCPLYSNNGRFIGQLWGGQAACGFPFNDYYGRLAVAWNGVSSFLDPIGSGATSIDGLGGVDPPAQCEISKIGASAGGANIGDLDTTGDAQIGTTVQLSVSGFNGNSSGLLLLSGSLQSTSILGGTIFVDYQNPFASIPFSIVNGSATVGASIPNNPGLVGFHGYAQVGTADPGQPFGWAFSNALDFAFCN